MKQHLGNFQLCKHLLATFQQQGALPPSELHRFLGRVDRTTLRMDCFFAPYQQVLAALSQQLLADQYLCSKPFLVARTCAVHTFLNYYSADWLARSASLLSSWLADRVPLDLEVLLSVYRCFVELGCDTHPAFLQQLRAQVLAGLLRETQGSEDLPRTAERLHKNLRVLLLDKTLQPD
jgi:hypothetical protein